MNLIDISVLTAAAGLSLVIWRLLNPPARIEVAERGILDRSLGVGWIQWDEIEGAYRPRDPDRLCLRVHVSERLSRKLQRRGAAVHPESIELCLDLAGTRFSELEILQQIVAEDHDEAPSPSAAGLPRSV